MTVRRSWQRRPLLGLVALLAIVLTAFFIGSGSGGGPAGVSTETGLPGLAATDLPVEAQATLDLIARDGPFTYERDGATFENREGLLPGQPSGYYHEYTVPTPGEDDRGARRLVTGAGGEVYYTTDHYDSFVRVLDP